MAMLRNSNKTRKTFWAAIFCALPIVAFAANGNGNGNGMTNENGSETNGSPSAQMAPEHEASAAASIQKIQSALNEKDGAGLTVDGKLGPKTMAALKKFQESHGLPATGHPNPETDKALGL